MDSQYEYQVRKSSEYIGTQCMLDALSSDGFDLFMSIGNEFIFRRLRCGLITDPPTDPSGTITAGRAPR